MDVAEPGGSLQWVERDWLSKFPDVASKSDDPHTQLTCYLKQKFWSKTRFVEHPSFLDNSTEKW